DRLSGISGFPIPAHFRLGLGSLLRLFGFVQVLLPNALAGAVGTDGEGEGSQCRCGRRDHSGSQGVPSHAPALAGSVLFLAHENPSMEIASEAKIRRLVCTKSAAFAPCQSKSVLGFAAMRGFQPERKRQSSLGSCPQLGSSS